MQIFVGTNAYEVDSSTSIESLKVLLENREFVPAGQMRLTHGSSLLEDGTLSGNGVEDEDEITLALELPGGMRKKWRKKRMRRLRRKVSEERYGRCGISPDTAPQNAPTRPLRRIDDELNDGKRRIRF